MFAAIDDAAAAQRDAWIEKSWEGGQADPRELIELRTRADAYRGLIETPYERWAELNGVEPVEG